METHVIEEDRATLASKDWILKQVEPFIIVQSRTKEPTFCLRCRPVAFALARVGEPIPKYQVDIGILFIENLLAPPILFIANPLYFCWIF